MKAQQQQSLLPVVGTIVQKEGTKKRTPASTSPQLVMGSPSLNSAALPILPQPTSPPTGMNRRPVFSLCITCQLPYRLTALHLTSSTAIKAVDDNQSL
jgi:hypothetical protein